MINYSKTVFDTLSELYTYIPVSTGKGVLAFSRDAKRFDIILNDYYSHIIQVSIDMPPIEANEIKRIKIADVSGMNTLQELVDYINRITE